MKILTTFIVLTVHAMSTDFLILTPGVDASSLHCVGGKSSTSGVDYFMDNKKAKRRKPWERNEPSKKELIKYFEYKEGFLYCIVRRKNAPVGAKAGNTTNKYSTLSFKGTSYVTHRLIWIYHFGKIPVKYLLVCR